VLTRDRSQSYFKGLFGRAPAAPALAPVGRPRADRCQPARGAGATELEKRVSPAPAVSVREERRGEKNGSSEQ